MVGVGARWRVAWIVVGIGVVAHGCDGPSRPGSASPPDAADSPTQVARDQQRCERWSIGAQPGATPFDDPVCAQQAEAQRAFDARQTERIVAASDREREATIEQAGIDREASGDALPGDGAHLGKGWFCYRGSLSSEPFGQCERDAVACGMLMGQRIEGGMTTAQSRCERQVQAACFSATRSLAEGPRVFCFPDAELCAAQHAGTAGRADVSDATECSVYR